MKTSALWLSALSVSGVVGQTREIIGYRCVDQQDLNTMMYSGIRHLITFTQLGHGALMTQDPSWWDGAAHEAQSQAQGQGSTYGPNCFQLCEFTADFRFRRLRKVWLNSALPDVDGERSSQVNLKDHSVRLAVIQASDGRSTRAMLIPHDTDYEVPTDGVAWQCFSSKQELRARRTPPGTAGAKHEANYLAWTAQGYPPPLEKQAAKAGSSQGSKSAATTRARASASPPKVSSPDNLDLQLGPSSSPSRQPGASQVDLDLRLGPTSSPKRNSTEPGLYSDLRLGPPSSPTGHPGGEPGPRPNPNLQLAPWPKRARPDETGLASSSQPPARPGA